MDPLIRFEFSQSSLQDFTDCRRRFQLRYLQHVAWPAVQAEPARDNERLMQRGDRFHRLTQQFLLGVPEADLNRMAEADEDVNLLRWWQNFLECIPPALQSASALQGAIAEQGVRFVEAALETPLGRFRLVAKYDLILLLPDGRVVIYDWKTSTKRPARDRLQARLQTHVYPYLMVQAGAALNHGKPVQPEQVEMIYWFAEPGQAEERFSYDAAQYAADSQYLAELLTQISTLPPEEFHMAHSEKACPYCVYRSLCRRGTKAGDMDEIPEEEITTSDQTIYIDLEQIAEIGF